MKFIKKIINATGKQKNCVDNIYGANAADVQMITLLWVISPVKIR
jgi:hypothetical protein